MEIWKTINNYPNYQVSNLGNVRSVYVSTDKNNRYFKKNKTNIMYRQLRPRYDKDGYIMVCLYKDKKYKNFRLHRLIAEMFIPNPNNYPEVNHEDGNKQNNCVDNLKWCTTSENQLHSCYVLKNNIKSVVQYDLNGNFIKKWESIRHASRCLNIPHNGIVANCKGKQKTSGGYTWKYESEVMPNA